jgi:multisubunit Na+/H+ antiporter MnhB subunit
MDSLNRIVPISFIAGALLSILGAYLKIRHVGSADYILAAGLLCSVVFIILALVEVWNTDRVRKQDRVLWTIAILLLGSLGGLLYFIFGRRRN